MSRIGKQPVVLPSGVKAEVLAKVVSIEGSRGKLECPRLAGVNVELSDSTLTLAAADSSKQTGANFGTMRSVLTNMVTGVTTGWKRSLEMNGTGYSAEVKDNVLTLKVGLSHDVNVSLPVGMKVQVNRNTIELESNVKQEVGDLAARIRRVRKPDPYLAKGIRYSDEQIKRKAGKTGAK